MSKSFKGSKPSGYDYGSKYNCNRKYMGSLGKIGKADANSERRCVNKKVILSELLEYVSSVLENRDE